MLMFFLAIFLQYPCDIPAIFLLYSCNTLAIPRRYPGDTPDNEGNLPGFPDVGG